MKILMCGLPGAGKTTLAKELLTRLPNCVHLNADRIREAFNDWDFSPTGRARQALRMNTMAVDLLQNNEVNIVIADFVAPTKELRKVYNPDFVIWVDTIESGRFEDTNKVWEPLNENEYNVRVTHYLTEQEVIELCHLIQSALQA
jgi:adenylylsulfate kinase